MSNRRLIAFMIGWVLASIAMGVIAGVIVTEILHAIGVVESGKASYAVALNLVTFTTAAVLIAVPFVFGSRFVDDDE